MKIKDITLNQVITIPLVVTSAIVRETKSKKPYLALEFYDGTDTISGNYWDWNGLNIPQKNMVLDVRAQVTEWQGTKQLNIKGMSTNTELHISNFMPSSDADIGAVYKNAYALLSDIKDDTLRDLSLGILEDLQGLWLTVPGAKGVHHAYAAGTLVHCYSVACIAKAIATVVPDANIDLCIAGGMLHDVGKLYSYHVDGITIDMTPMGALYDHTFIGAEYVKNYAKNVIVNSTTAAKIEMLVHIILSHHGKLEYGAAVTPASIEAYIVSYADAIDASAEQVREASKKSASADWTDRIWTLGNKPHLSTRYVKRVMECVTAE